MKKSAIIMLVLAYCGLHATDGLDDETSLHRVIRIFRGITFNPYKDHENVPKNEHKMPRTNRFVINHNSHGKDVKITIVGRRLRPEAQPRPSLDMQRAPTGLDVQQELNIPGILDDATEPTLGEVTKPNVAPTQIPPAYR